MVAIIQEAQKILSKIAPTPKWRRGKSYKKTIACEIGLF
jgi:hypothetical protein